MADTMRFSLVGDDRLSPALNRAGDSAMRMAGEIQHAAGDADLAMAGLARDVSGHVRDAESRAIPEAEALGRSIGGRIRNGMDGALSGLRPVIEVTADERPADRRVHLLVQRIEALRAAQIGVDVDPDQAIADLEAIRTEANRLARTHPDVQVQAHITEAVRELDTVREEVQRLQAARATVSVDVDADRAREEIRRVDEDTRRLGDDDGPDRAGRRFGALGSVVGRVGSVLGSLGSAVAPVAGIGAAAAGAVPVVAGLVAWLEAVAPAAAVAATGALAIGSAFGAVKLGTAGIGDAISAAFAPATGGGGGGGGGRAAAAATNAFADAQRNLKDVVQQTAQSNQQALRQEAMAERDLADAQKDAKRAQEDLVQAREDARRQLRDMNDSLADAKLSERDAEVAVQDAEEDLAAVRAKGSAASQEEQTKAQLALDKANQQLKEQQERVQDLQADTDKANKAGVAGSEAVRDAQDKVASTARDVSDRQQAVADAQDNVRRTAAAGVEAIDKAREALAQAGAAAAGGGGGGGAAGGIDAFAAAMAKLSPAARAFVQEIVRLKPAWDGMRLDVQQHLFAGLASVLDSTARTLLPVLHRSLVQSADSLNAAGKGAAAAAAGLGRSGVLGQALDGANAGLRNLATLPGLGVTAIGQLAAAAAPSFQKLTGAVDRAATRIADRLGTAFKSGALQRSIGTAAGLVEQFGHVLGNIGTIVSNVFAQVPPGSDGLIGSLSVLTGALAKATALPAVQSALSDLFTVMAEIGKVAGPLITQAIRVLGPVIVALAPPVLRLIDSLGAGLQPIITALGPVLLAAATAIGQLLDAVSPLLPVVGQMIASLGPILTPILGTIGQLFTALGPVIVALAPPVLRLIDSLGAGLQPIITALGPVLLAAATAIGQLLDAVSPLLPVVGQMIASLGPILTPILGIIGSLFTALAPVIAQLGQSLLPPLAKITGTLGLAFAQMTPVLDSALQQLGSQGLMPIITGLGTVIAQLVSQYADQFLTMFQQLLPVVPMLIPLLVLLGQSIGQILVAVAPLLPQIMLLGAQLISGLLPAIIPLIPLLVQVDTVFLKLATGVITGVVLPIISRLVKALGWITAAVSAVAVGVSWAVLEIVKPFRWLYDVLLGHSIIPDIVDGTIAWFGGLPGRAASAIGSLGSQLAGKARSAGGDLIRAVRGGLDGALGWIGDLPRRSKNALGDLSGVLFRSGKALIQGFIDGITYMGKAAGDAAGSVLGTIRDHFPNSPAKTGPFSGRGWTWYSGLAVMDDWTGAMSSRRNNVVGAIASITAAAAGAIPRSLPVPGLGVSPGAAAAVPRGGSGPISITVPGAGGIVLAKDLQRALLELKRVSGVAISLEIG